MNIPLRVDVASGLATGHYKDKEKFVKQDGESLETFLDRINTYIDEQTRQRIEEWEDKTGLTYYTPEDEEFYDE